MKKKTNQFYFISFKFNPLGIFFKKKFTTIKNKFSKKKQNYQKPFNLKSQKHIALTVLRYYT